MEVMERGRKMVPFGTALGALRRPPSQSTGRLLHATPPGVGLCRPPLADGEASATPRGIQFLSSSMAAKAAAGYAMEPTLFPEACNESDL